MAYAYEINFFFFFIKRLTSELQHSKRNKVATAHSEDSDKPGHPPSQIRAFAVHFMGS